MMNDSAPIAIIMGDSTSQSNLSLQGASVVSSLQVSENASYMDDCTDDVDEARLNLQNIELTGRRKEYSLLKAGYKRIQKGQNPSEVVLISGLSGTGKSKLAESIREPVTLQRHGFFVSGKFDQLRKEPYGAFIEAFSDLCDLVSQDIKTCAAIAKALEGDISVLSKVIPNLSTITGSDPKGPDSPNSSTASNHASFAQLRLACRKFLSTIASKEHPVVLLLDDLHWADSASAGVLQSIITDANSKYILVIGTYRSNEAEAVRDLLDIMEDEKGCLKCTSINLENFDHDQVSALISKCTSVKSEATRDLAALVIKRTNGHPLFVIRFLEMLDYSGLLEYDASSDKWLWSVDQIQKDTTTSDNIVEVVKARIQRLNHDDQSVLKIAAVMGFSFNKEVIRAFVVAQTLPSGSKSAPPELIRKISTQVDGALGIAEYQSLVESNSDGSFKFCHDSFCDCLYSMTPSGRQVADVHLLLARVMQKMDQNNPQVYVYAIADQLNRAIMLIKDDRDRLDCAQCNLRAAKLALTQSAFSLATDFARQGLEVVDVETKWGEFFYTSVLDLHCIAAEALYCCGQSAESNEILEVVFQHAGTIADLTRARTIHVYSLGAQGCLNEAVDAAYSAAREIGVKMPKNPTMAKAAWQLIKTKSKLRGKTDKQLLELPTQEINCMEDAVSLLGIATHYASIAVLVPHLIIVVTALMQLTLKRKCSLSSSFCRFGILETALGNTHGAVRMGYLTTKMHEIQNNDCNIPGDMCVVYSFLYHWRVPLLDTLEPLQNAYNTGLENGVFDVAFMAVAGWMQAAIFSGHPLQQLEPYMRTYCGKMNEFDHKSQTHLSLPYWQLCLNLLGQSDDPIFLTGEAMDEVTYKDDAVVNKVLLAPQTLNAVRIIVGCHFEYSHLLQKLIVEYESFYKPPVGHFMLYYSKFYVGLAYIRLSRTFSKRSDKRKARKIANQLKKWTRDGCPNTKPLWALMEAELATLGPRWKSDDERVGTLFLDAIQESAAVQNLCLEAMANERAARYYQTRTPKEQLARLYMGRAIELYEKYGAFAKIEFLERTSTLLSNGSTKRAGPPEIIASSAVGMPCLAINENDAELHALPPMLAQRSTDMLVR